MSEGLASSSAGEVAPHPRSGGQDDVLPESLEEVPEERRIRDIVGIGFGALAGGAAIVFVGYLLRGFRSGFDVNVLKMGGGALGVAVICGGIEYWRHRTPRVLVPDGPELGVYLGGRLATMVPFRHLTWYKLSFLNTFREVALFGVLSLFGLPYVLLVVTAGHAGIDLAWGLAVGLTLPALLVNSVLTRILSRHYFLPDGAGARTAVMRKSALTRAGWPF